jgi:hypothetical protein
MKQKFSKSATASDALGCPWLRRRRDIGRQQVEPVGQARHEIVRVGAGAVVEDRIGEQLGGFYLIDAKDLDEAISIAERIPAAGFGTVEIRPVLEIPGLPANE